MPQTLKFCTFPTLNLCERSFLFSIYGFSNTCEHGTFCRHSDHFIFLTDLLPLSNDLFIVTVHFIPLVVLVQCGFSNT